ncbi:MAG TPA: phosphatase PAP2 family protein [Terriglobales bacterium]|nr:phosphatase PAP2 family protein [Terriglobales bacterium]
MGHLDYTIVTFFNQVVNRWLALDTFLLLWGSSALLRGCPVAILIWWCWFKEGKQQRQNREILLYGIIVCMGAVLLARTVAHALPFRQRPIHNPELVLRFAEGLARYTLRGWSSFPSDHAAVFFALATSLWMVSRPTGALATAHTLFLVCLPRVCLGFHYPSDILGGAAIGVSLALLGLSVQVRGLVIGHALRWLDRSPQYFYAAFFFLTYMIATVFSPVDELWRFSPPVAQAAMARKIHTLVAANPLRMEWIVGTILFLLAGSLLAMAVRRVWTRRQHSHAHSHGR